MIVLVVLLVGAATFLALEALTVRQKQVAANLRRAAAYGGVSQRDEDLGRSVSDRLLAPGAARLAQIALRLTPKGSIEETSRRLRSAGLVRVNPTSFLAFKMTLAGSFVGLGVLLLMTGSKAPAQALMIGLGGGAACFLMPDSYLTMKQRARKEEIVSDLPDVLDLLTVSVEAGLGFDAALIKVSERMGGHLVDELATVIHEMRIGESRAKALRSFSDRVDTPETTAFARAIIQADQLGISLGRILRVQAQDVRHRRQMAAEERAMKAPIKMLFPTAVFIFPAMFIVALGPAMIQLLDLFK